MTLKTRPGLTIMVAALVWFGLLLPGVARATTQFPDLLYLDGRKYFLDSLPLEQHFGPDHPRGLALPRCLNPDTYKDR